MKKFLLFLLLISSTALKLFSQSITNSGFENWDTIVYFEEPNFGLTSNLSSYFNTESGNVQKTTDSFAGNFAAKLTTVSSVNDTISGVIFIGNPNGNELNGGIPVNVRPTNLVCAAKFNIQANDTGRILVVFKKTGFNGPLGAAEIVFTGNQSTYQNYSSPILWFDLLLIPDTMIAIMSSSNLNSYPAIPLSTLYLDNVGFTGALGAPSSNFETWIPAQSLEPNSWKTPNYFLIGLTPSVTRSTDAMEGQFALKIQNVLTYDGQDTVGFVTNGYFGNNIMGGMQVFQNPQTISGFYKYSPVGLDTAIIGVLLTRYDPILMQTIRLDSMLIQLLPTNSYQPFLVPLFYNGWPAADTINITFASGNFEYNQNFIGLGSVLLVDDLSVDYFPVSNKEDNVFNSTMLYPNPASNEINISASTFANNSKINIFDLKGKLVKSALTSINKSLDVTDLSNGLYIYQLVNNEKIETGKINIQH